VTHRATLIPGDGIGPEVCEAARRALEATGVAFEWDLQEVGAESYAREGHPLLKRAIASVRERGLALKGPTSTPAVKGYRSLNIALRKELDLYAGIRPCRHFEGVRAPYPGTDVVVIRMNQEDLYEGIEYRHGEPATEELRRLVRDTRGVELSPDAGVSLKPLSGPASARVARRAFEYARANGRRKITAVHKATVMRFTDGVFLEACREVAGDYPDIEFDDQLVDNVCHQLVSHPEQCDVLLCPIMYGDILSDVAAGLVGGLGMAPGANVGDSAAVFEAVHGSAPKHAGQNRANPFALMLSGAMLLRHVDEQEAAGRLETAIAAVVADGRTLTYDLKPSRDDPTAASTSEVTDAVIAQLSQ
jgi:isocitrate dehydrogenase (NAD+)